MLTLCARVLQKFLVIFSYPLTIRGLYSISQHIIARLPSSSLKNRVRVRSQWGYLGQLKVHTQVTKAHQSFLHPFTTDVIVILRGCRNLKIYLQVLVARLAITIYLLPIWPCTFNLTITNLSVIGTDTYHDICSRIIIKCTFVI